MTIDNIVEYFLYWWVFGTLVVFCTHFYTYWIDKTDMIIDFRSLRNMCAIGVTGPFALIYAYHALKEPEKDNKTGLEITFDDKKDK